MSFGDEITARAKFGLMHVQDFRSLFRLKYDEVVDGTFHVGMLYCGVCALQFSGRDSGSIASAIWFQSSLVTDMGSIGDKKNSDEPNVFKFAWLEFHRRTDGHSATSRVLD